ncbi:hypothetical protein [Neisseria dentiae]|uniref:hypothetical protein n=1 Tax=Neisseria dentiae TaxID=194197 RepID=UPI0035A15241
MSTFKLPKELVAFIDDIFGMLGLAFAVLFILVLFAVGFAFYPIISSIVAGLFVIGLLMEYLGKGRKSA